MIFSLSDGAYSTIQVVDYSATWLTLKPKLKKQKKSTLKNTLYVLEKIFPIFSEMELSRPEIKTFLILSNPNLKLFPEKNPFWKICYLFLYFGKWNFLAPRLKIFLYFPKKSFSYMSRNRLYFTILASKFSLRKISYIFSGKKIALKKFIIFWEMELSSLKFKNFLYLRREIAKPEKQKSLIFL